MNYVFYDTETTGTDPKFDQVLQFAAILTDENFREIDSINVRCRLMPYMVPAPGALLVTGVKPADLTSAPMSMFEMACFISEKLTSWSPACFCGFNILHFDEEAIRQMLWQALIEPYLTTSRGSTRLDLLKLMEVAHAVHPGIVRTALTEKGNISFKLDRIAPLNGFANHHAHDALGDVRATIFMADLVRKADPEIFRHQAAMADAKNATKLVEQNRMLHYMTHFGQPKVYEAGVVAQQPSNRKSALFFDLSADPSRYLDLSPEALAEQIADTKSPLKVVRLNAQPAIHEPGSSPFQIDIPIETDVLVRRLDALRQPEFVKQAEKALEIRAASFPTKTFLEERIYEGFPNHQDKALMGLFHRTADWNERRNIADRFQDERFRHIAKRIIFCEAPQAMRPTEALPMEAGVIRKRLLDEDETLPFNTLPKAIAEAAKMADSPDVIEIRAWLEERRMTAVTRLSEIENTMAAATDAAEIEAPETAAAHEEEVAAASH